MMYKNTFKSILSNFNLVWKILAYSFLCVACVIGVAYACSLPIIRLLEQEGMLNSCVDLIKDFSSSLNIYSFLKGVVALIDTFFGIITANISKLWLSIVLFLIIVVILVPFLSGFCKFATINSLYYYFSSNIKIGFTASLFSCFKTNIKYQLASLLVQLPINAGFFALFYFITRWIVLSEGLILLAPITLMIIALLMFGFKVTLFSGWIPAIIVFEGGVWQGLKKGVKAVFRRFNRTFSTALLIILSLVVFNTICAVCTFGASLIITLPLTMLGILVFGMVMFYSSQGMRFYVDSETVITPKRLEETDGLRTLKYII